LSEIFLRRYRVELAAFVSSGSTAFWENWRHFVEDVKRMPMVKANMTNERSLAIPKMVVYGFHTL
jgi:hypothetical protein